VRIASLYQALAQLLPTPIVQLNRAVAVGWAHGPQAGLAIADSLADDPTLRDYHLLPSVRGDLLLRSGLPQEARVEFERAASLTKNAAERAFLRRRADEIAVGSGVTLQEAVRDFLERDDLDASTVRSYGQTLRRMCLTLGDRTPLASLTAADVKRVFVTSWGSAAARTWNRHRSAIRSFGAWASLQDLASEVSRRTETAVPAEPISLFRLEELCGRVSLRERTLWLLLHESGAAVTAVLALNVENLDLADRRARVGDTWVTWRSRTARLLPDLIAGRTQGPLFLSDRRPGPARTPADADLCPETGRRRLSYERAEYLFKQASDGCTLRQLKP
jgi:integrase